MAPGCADQGDGDAAETGAGETETGSPEDPAVGGGMGAVVDSIRGTFVFVDGTEADLDVSASYRRFEFGETVQYSCEGSDLATGLSLGVTWRDETGVGTHAASFSDGPGFIAAWPQADGSGIRATLPSGGEVTFARVGTQAGDVVEGTARAVLMPEADDPDDRVSEIVEIEFSCLVVEDE